MKARYNYIIAWVNTVLTLLLFSLIYRVAYAASASVPNGDAYSSLIYLESNILWISAISILLSCINQRFAFTINLLDIVLGCVALIAIINTNTLKWHREYIILASLCYTSVRLTLNANEKNRFIMKYAIYIFVIMECWLGFKQIFNLAPSNHTIFKLTGTFSNPGPFGGFIAILLPLSLYDNLNKPISKLKNLTTVFRRPYFIEQPLSAILSFVAMFFSITLLPAGMSRSSWLAAIFGSAVVIISKDRIKLYITNRTKSFVFISAAILIVIFSAIGLYVLKPDSADGRLLMWRCSANTIMSHSMFGTGVGRFAGSYGASQSAYFTHNVASKQEILVADAPEYAFNEYLQIGIESGIITQLLVVCALCIALKWSLISQNNHIKAEKGVAGAIIAIAIFSLSSYPLRIVTLGIVIATILAYTASLKTQNKPRPIIWLITVVTLITLSIYVKMHPTYSIDDIRKWEQERIYFSMDVFEKTADNYAKLYPVFREDYNFLFEYGQCLSKVGLYPESDSILLQGVTLSSDPMFFNILGKNAMLQNCYEKADDYFNQAHLRVPNRLYPLYLQLQLYKEVGDTSKIEEQCIRLIKATPKVLTQTCADWQKEAKETLEFITKSKLQ